MLWYSIGNVRFFKRWSRDGFVLRHQHYWSSANKFFDNLHAMHRESKSRCVLFVRAKRDVR